MPVTVTMPQLGETVTEGTILSWTKQAGESIAEDEVLVEISTDKVDTEMPSPASGVISEILVQAGETVAVGTAIAIIGEAADAVVAQEPGEGSDRYTCDGSDRYTCDGSDRYTCDGSDRYTCDGSDRYTCRWANGCIERGVTTSRISGPDPCAGRHGRLVEKGHPFTCCASSCRRARR